ncbi:MAG: MFS transporter [Eubacteriales bacterium]
MLSSKHTVRFCYIGYLTQAITINFAPLLFVTFEKTYDISLFKISLLIAISFTTQFLADLFEAKFAKYLDLRKTCVTAHLCAAAGMIGFAFLPELLPSPYAGLVLSVIIAAVGGGLIEVVISPIVEACPTKKKSAAMSLLHSFYSWGLAGVVLLSTLFFRFFGIENWRILTCLWAIIPLIGAVGFMFVPIYSLDENEAVGKSKTTIFRQPIFWVFMVLMVCAGASEQTMSQWASTFAETGLGVSKSLGDLLGPFAFAMLMGASRVMYALFSKKIKLRVFMTVSCALCIVSFLMAALSPIPLISLLGCALCGLSVGIMWPGTYSLAAKKLPGGGVRLFAMLAFAGDIGCLTGPTSAGWIAGLFGDNLKAAFLFAVVFPVLMIVLVRFTKTRKARQTLTDTGNNA